MIKKFLKNITPPFLLKLKGKPKYGFFGNYKSWEEAKSETDGYASEKIFEKVKDAALKVRRGEVAYERDSVIFDKKQYSWPLLSSLLWISSKQGNKLNLVDFGGSLGTSYYQNRSFLNHLSELKWNIVEQKKFVETGKKMFSDGKLGFYYSIEDCLKEQKANVLLLSSVLQYLEKPYEFLEKIHKDFEYIIIDRTPLFEKEDRIVVQKIPPRIYEASYPAWILNEEKLKKFMEKRYKLIADFDAHSGATIELGDTKAVYRGFIFKKNA